MNEAVLERAAALIEEEKEFATPELRAKLDAQISRVRRAGRKPLAPELLRSHRVMTNFNESEIATLKEAAAGRDLAEVVRELALKAANEAIAARNER